MDDETKSGRLTHQLGRLHAWKGGITGQPYLEIVSLTIANMCQANRGEVSPQGVCTAVRPTMASLVTKSQPFRNRIPRFTP